MNNYRWEVEQIDGKWFCNGYSYERMRFTDEGNLQLGCSHASETHEFTTEWAARAQKRFCERLQEDVNVLTVGQWASKYGSGTARVNVSVTNSFEWRLGNRTVIAFDQRHQVKTFDLPYIVWCWIKTTAVARGLRAFWYGWGQKPSHQ